MNGDGLGERQRALLADLVDREYASLFAYIHSLVGDRALSQDLVQESFLRAFDARRLPRRLPTARVWLYRLATELALASTTEDLPDRDSSRGESRPAWATGTASAPGQQPPASWSGGQAPAGLSQTLAALPPPQAALLLLHRRLGFGLAAAASVLGIRGRAAAELLARAYAASFRLAEPIPPAEAHPVVWPALARYDELEAVARSRVDAHLQGCPSCAARFAAYTQLTRDLARQPEPWPLPHARALLSAAIRRGDTLGLPRRADLAAASRPRRLARLAAGALIALVLALGLLGIPAAGGPALLDRLKARPAAPATTTATIVPAALPGATPIPASPAAGLPPAAALAWLQAHAFPLVATEPGGGSGDLVPLRGVMDRSHLVVFDDAAGFGSHEAQAFRQRLLEILAGELGYDTLLLPLDWGTADLLNQYIQGAELDPLQLLATTRANAAPAGGLWQSQEMLYTLRWLRGYNSRPGAHAVVAIRGYLPITQPSPIPRDVILAFLEDVDPPALVWVDHALATDPKAVVSFLQDREVRYVARSSEGLYRRALAAAKAQVQYETVAGAATGEQRDVVIDAATMLNVMAGWSERGPDGKQIIWTPGLASPRLTYLDNLLQAERRGGAALVIGQLFQSGSLYVAANGAAAGAGVAPAPAGLQSIRVPEPPAGSYEAYLAQGPRANFLLDLRRAFGAAEETTWLRETHPVRTLPQGPAGCPPATQPVRLNRIYDVVVYFREVTPANLLAPQSSPAAPAAGACAAGP